MLQKMKNASATEPVSLTIDGHPAMQDELSGTEKGTNVVFLHTTVDDGDQFQQILAWTLKSRWKNKINYCAKLPELFTARNRRHSHRVGLGRSFLHRPFLVLNDRPHGYGRVDSPSLSVFKLTAAIEYEGIVSIFAVRCLARKALKTQHSGSGPQPTRFARS